MGGGGPQCDYSVCPRPLRWVGQVKVGQGKAGQDRVRQDRTGQGQDRARTGQGKDGTGRELDNCTKLSLPFLSLSNLCCGWLIVHVNLSPF